MANPSPGFSKETNAPPPDVPPAPSDADPSAKPPSNELSALFYRNLLLLIAFGVFSCAWLLHYSDWFETVGGILALGGALSWFAFVSRALPKDALEQMQWRFANVLGKRSAAKIIMRSAAAALLAANFLGSISVEPRQDAFGHYLYLYAVGEDLGEPLGLTSGQPTRFVRPAFPFFGWSRRLKIPGLPSKSASFVPWVPAPVYVPHYFDRKVFLIVSNLDATLNLKGNPATIRLTVSGSVNKSACIKDYRGYSFWLNCAPDVTVPAARQIEAWLAISPGNSTATYKEQWLTSRRVALESCSGAPLSRQDANWDDLDLHNGDTIRIEELVPEGRETDFDVAERPVHASHSYDEAIEIVVLKKGG